MSRPGILRKYAYPIYKGKTGWFNLDLEVFTGNDLFNDSRVHVGPERFRYCDAAVRLLVVLHDSYHDARQGQSRAVQRMDQTGLGFRIGAIADIGPPGLEITAVAAGANLEPLLAAGSPHLNIECFDGGEPQVAGAQLDNAVRQPQFLADVLGVAHQFGEFAIRGLRFDELIHLNLFELVPAFDAAGILPGGHFFPAEAGCMGYVINGEGGRRNDLVTVKVGQRHLGSGDEPVIFLRIMIQIIGKLGQVARSYQTVSLNHKGRIYFGISVLLAVRVQHEID